MQLLAPNVHMIPAGPVNTYLIEDPSGLLLIDTGFSRHVPHILSSIRETGRSPQELKHILITHAHPDHAGAAAGLKKHCNAQIWAPASDAPILRGEEPMRPLKRAPGLLRWAMFTAISMMKETIPPVHVDRELHGDETLPFGKGLRLIHTPGHTKGHLALLLEGEQKILFAVDTCANLPGLGLDLSVAYEDIEEGKRSLRKLCDHEFDMVCFGHGKPIRENAAERFRAKWK